MVCVTDADGKLYPLGGNMRLKALQELKYKEIPDAWIMLADEWSEEKRKEFTIKDNVGFGEFDWDALANEWNVDELAEWGLDIPNFEIDEVTDYSDKNKVIDTDEFSDKMTLKFEVSQDEYEYILSELQKNVQGDYLSSENFLASALCFSGFVEGTTEKVMIPSASEIKPNSC